LEDQITIVGVGTRHENDRRGRRELPDEMDVTRDLFRQGAGNKIAQKFKKNAHSLEKSARTKV
jgi:hypothetical protein